MQSSQKARPSIMDLNERQQVFMHTKNDFRSKDLEKFELL